MSDNSKPIYVTRPSLPPLGEFSKFLDSIWKSRYLTNCGPCHQELEERLGDYLGVSYISLFSSGSAALFASLKLSDLPEGSEVITTPFTFIATANSIMWCGLKPVFVDIDPVTANINPMKIEDAITSRTSAILAVHCYGQVCDIDAIAAIAAKYSLKVIYDGAHAFGVENENSSILNAGDFTALSFHATKVFNTAEGGALICRNMETKKRIDSFKNFGFTGEITVEEVGFNGKMSELSAALGLAQLGYVDSYIEKRQKIDLIYREALKDINGVSPFDFVNLKRANYSYFPVRIGENYPLSRDALFEKFKTCKVFTRRYFYPLLTSFEPYKANNYDICEAEKLAQEILCLPIYETMSLNEQKRIISVL